MILNDGYIVISLMHFVLYVVWYYENIMRNFIFCIYIIFINFKFNFYNCGYLIVLDYYILEYFSNWLRVNDIIGINCNLKIIYISSYVWFNDWIYSKD